MANRKRLILIKHSEPAIDPGAPPNSWHLSEEGRRRSTTLATRLEPYMPEVVLTSEEPKATETAQIVSDWLGLKVIAHPRLHEHDRTSAPFGTQEDFERTASIFFESPGELVWGNETAEQARERFSGAIDDILERYPCDTVAVVAHGTVSRSSLLSTPKWRLSGFGNGSGFLRSACLRLQFFSWNPRFFTCRWPWVLRMRRTAPGRGLGGKMLVELFGLARRSGFGTIILGVSKENRRAIALYRRHGFVAFAEDNRALLM